MFNIGRISWRDATLKQVSMLLALLAGIVMFPYAAAIAPKDMLVIGKAADPQTLDPAVTIDNNDWTITYPSYQRLVRYKTAGGKASTQVEGDLAESWTTSDEGRIWTFTLRPGNKFDDGSEVNADAVKWSFERLIKAGHGPSEAFPEGLQITVIDSMKVRFTLNVPFAPFLYTLANNGASIVNPAVAKVHHEDNGAAWLSNHTAGSGPYKLEHWQQGQQLVLVPNPWYKGPQPSFKRVIIKIIGESSTRRLQLVRGDLDIAEALPVDQLAAMKNEKNLIVTEYPSLRVTYLYLNNAKAPLNQVDLRRAISMSVDYQGIIQGILGGNAKQMRGPIPEGMWAADAAAQQYSLDPEKATMLLKKIQTRPETLRFLYSVNDPNWEPIALSVQASLASAGINVELEKLANTALRDRVDKGNYDIAIGNWSPDFADPYMFMNYWFDSDKKGLAGNRAFYSNVQVDNLLRKAVLVSSQKQRIENYQAVQKIVIDEAAYVYLFQKNYQVAINRDVKGFVFNSMLEQVFNIAEMSKL